VYDDVGGISGKYVHRHFCGVCGKWVQFIFLDVRMNVLAD
jgi:hypothetical protein